MRRTSNPIRKLHSVFTHNSFSALWTAHRHRLWEQPLMSRSVRQKNKQQMRGLTTLLCHITNTNHKERLLLWRTARIRMLLVEICFQNKQMLGSSVKSMQCTCCSLSNRAGGWLVLVTLEVDRTLKRDPNLLVYLQRDVIFFKWR